MRTSVFISSPSDVDGFRRLASALLRDKGYQVQSMDDMAAERAKPLYASLRDVETADLIIGIVGTSYGTIPEEDNPKHYSFTELEYDHAIHREKDSLWFLKI